MYQETLICAEERRKPL